MVGLAEIDLDAGAPGLVFHALGNVVERVIAVDVRLADTEQIEIGTVQHEDFSLVRHP